MTLAPEQQARTYQDIDTAERYALAYDCDDRDGIVTDVLNAFYAGIRYERKRVQLESATVPSEPVRLRNIGPDGPAPWSGAITACLVCYGTGRDVAGKRCLFDCGAKP